jgi:hypothetical protein
VKVHLPARAAADPRCAAVRDAQRAAAFVFFLPASPPQIGNAIREKLDLDGIEVRRHHLQGPAAQPGSRYALA